MRKIPKQTRSKFLVKSIVDATARVIATEGIDAVTTLNVAKVAGISVGSLYQYFEDKTDLYQALLERIISDLSVVVIEAMQHDAPKSMARQEIQHWTKKVLHSSWDYLEKDPQQIQFLNYGLELGFVNNVEQLYRRIKPVMIKQIQLISGDVVIKNLDTKLFIITNGVIFTVVRSISASKTEFIRDDVIEALALMVSSTLLTDH